ncbi:MAG: YggS family pyridoxal phosphate-dependent enzyme [Verrucomicrobia bacterium]|jgi:PLP dependent protein|nr:YggS family pyridoxal phosphate-dependent enzyme [Verrucomicrobiota bacterium]MBT7067201.1 YggS family pyridoxal phosphate-dependent enzyme [Verrucomicrobiota bacterium]MBT7701123.1 YggS family pyridoxal phosphate-dependent enzyme [Verrucomicrobiota bacterium]
MSNLGIEQVRARIAQACARAGRPVESVKLVAVSKRQSPDAVRALAEAGVELFGESRAQEARQKIPLCPGDLTWHMIGHIQRNKVRDIVRLFSYVHSVDSLRLLEALDGAAAEAGKTLSVLLEVNVSGEGSKFGFVPDEVPAVLERCGSLMNLDVAGLMTIPPFTPEPAEARPHFARLRELRDTWREATGFPLDELSMGMSHDFEVAIEEGATWIRLGTILFGDRE